MRPIGLVLIVLGVAALMIHSVTFFTTETVAGPFFNGANPDQFAVYFTLDVTPKATGKRITLEEVGVYTVNKNDQITREQFFYDGLFMDADSQGNTIDHNDAYLNAEHDCHDDSVGGGTAGTANYWIQDKGNTENRPGLCKSAN